MVSLWGSKKDDDPDAAPSGNGESSDRVAHQQPRHSEADERTRLIPPSHEGYLSPDDPAVCTHFLIHADVYSNLLKI